MEDVNGRIYTTSKRNIGEGKILWCLFIAVLMTRSKVDRSVGGTLIVSVLQVSAVQRISLPTQPQEPATITEAQVN